MNLFLTDPENPARIRPPAPPAVFGLPVRTLNIAAHWHSPATGALLAAEVGRRPENLHSHVQRISLWHSLGDPVELAAAVLDLWIVLGSFGQDLRLRMLRTHYDALEQYEMGTYLSSRLQHGIQCHDPCVALPGVVLARPVEGEREFLRQVPHSLAIPA